MNTFDVSAPISNSEIIRTANRQAHEVAAANSQYSGVQAYTLIYTRVFNYLFRKLVMPATDETPGWVVRLANYFTFDSEIDEIEENVARSEFEVNDRGDPLNQAEYVSLTIRFKLNGSGPVYETGTEKLTLESTQTSDRPIA